MDAVEFIEAWDRMCKSCALCVDCPLDGEMTDCFCGVETDTIVPIVEQWTKEHPIKTRQSVFLEQWPNAQVGDGLLFCPKPVDTTYFCCCASKSCSDCRREFWMQKVE